MATEKNSLFSKKFQNISKQLHDSIVMLRKGAAWSPRVSPDALLPAA